MLRVRPLARLLIPAAMLTVSACSDSPVAPTPAPMEAPSAAAPSLITPLLLPPGAEWGLYFNSFNPDRFLAARVIHYPNTGNAASGDGAFAIPAARGRKLIGVLRVQSAEGYGGCVPYAAACDQTNLFYPLLIPESAKVTGLAVVNGRTTGFRLDLQSNLWPLDFTRFDLASLRFCGNPAALATCGEAYTFYGELHHEPT
jgi:hypothetical protein